MQKKYLPWVIGGGTALGIGALVLFWPKKAMAATKTAPRAPQERQIGMPARDGDSLSLQFGDRVLVTFTNPLPAGYKWAPEFRGDFVADIAKSPYQLGSRKIETGEEAGKTYVAYDEYTVFPRGKGDDRIDFVARPYDAYDVPIAGQIYHVSFFLAVA